MSRRSRGHQDAQAKTREAASTRPVSGPTIRGVATAAAASQATQRAKEPWEEGCPVCGADIFEEGGTGCCSALVVECEGSVDGVPVDWAEVDDDDEDSVRDRLVHHAWYLDTGAPAPSDYSRTSGPTDCRCGTPAH